MRKPLMLLGAVLISLTACESTPHYNRTTVVPLMAPLPKRPYGTVKLYQSKAEVTRAFDKVAILSVEGNAGEEAAFIKAFLYRGADLGADAVIVERATVINGTEARGWGSGGSFGLRVHPTQHAVFRGEAIRFKE